MDRGDETVTDNQLLELKKQFLKPAITIPQGAIRHVIKDFFSFAEKYDDYELMELDDLIEKFLETIYETVNVNDSFIAKDGKTKLYMVYEYF